MLESMKPRLKTREGATQALCRGEAPLDTRYAPNAIVITCHPYTVSASQNIAPIQDEMKL